MIAKLLISFCVCLYAIGVPILETNDTHVFNPDWTPHVRIHEVWQLLTNTAIGVVCLWLVWLRQSVLMGAVLSLLVTGGFLVAYNLRGFYGGSMKYLDGSEKLLFDINIGVVGFGLAVGLLLLTIVLELWRKRSLQVP
ncbi:MAG: hypothetical protein VXZ35_02860 [Pseudomonadota bacterium]|nr:hypothetical protein [Pseudomonadota bacterium]